MKQFGMSWREFSANLCNDFQLNAYGNSSSCRHIHTILTATVTAISTNVSCNFINFQPWAKQKVPQIPRAIETTFLDKNLTS